MRRIRTTVDVGDGKLVQNYEIDVLDETDKDSIIGILRVQNEIDSDQYDRIKKLEASLEELISENKNLHTRIMYLEIENRKLI